MGRKMKVQTEVLSADTFLPSINSFFERITAEQWNSLTSGLIDEATKIIVGELILDIISSVTNNLSTAIKSHPKSKECILSGLEESLRKNLSKALHIPEHVDDPSLRRLTDLIQGAARENLDSVLSGTQQRLIPSGGLNMMIRFAFKVLKKFPNTVKKFFAPCRYNQRKESLVEKDQGLVSSNGDDGSQSPRRSDLQEELSKELNEILTPILDGVPDSQYEKVYFDTTVEIKTLSDDIVSLTDETKEKSKFFKAAMRKIRNFITKCFLSVRIRHLWEQLKKEHPCSSKDESSHSVESLIDGVIAWLQAGNGDSLVLGLNNVSSSDFAFTQALNELLCRHLLSGMNTDIENEPLPESYAELYADIANKSWKFSVLMNWFLKSELIPLSEKVKLPNMDEVPLSETATAVSDSATSDCGVEYNAMKVEKKKAYVEFLIEKVVAHIFLEAKMMPEDNYDLNYLFEEVWAQVQDADLCISKKSFKNLDKKIHKGLCAKLSNPNMVVYLLKYSEEPVIVEYIVSIIMALMAEQPNVTRVSRLVSFFRRPFCKCFRHHRVTPKDI